MRSVARRNQTKQREVSHRSECRRSTSTTPHVASPCDWSQTSAHRSLGVAREANILARVTLKMRHQGPVDPPAIELVERGGRAEGLDHVPHASVTRGALSRAPRRAGASSGHPTTPAPAPRVVMRWDGGDRSTGDREHEHEQEQTQRALREKLAEQRAVRARVLGLSAEEYARLTAHEPDMWLGDDRSLAVQPDELDEDEPDEGGSAGTSTTPSPHTPHVCVAVTKEDGGVTGHTRKPHVDIRGVSGLTREGRRVAPTGIEPAPRGSGIRCRLFVFVRT
jgi:hypothetical protein